MNFKRALTAAGTSCLCVCTLLTVCSSCQESPYSQPAESSAPVSIIVPDESTEIIFSDNNYDFQKNSLTDEEKKKIGTKTLHDFEQKSKIKDIANESETLFSKVVEKKIFRNETHYTMTIYKSDSENQKTNLQFLELQQSKDCFYCNTNANILGNTIVLKIEDKMYRVIPSEKICVETNRLSPDTDIFSRQLKYLAEELKETGMADFDGKKMKYERYANFGETQTIAYFHNEDFYKMEIYSQEEKEYILSGYVNLELDLPISPSLFEIPSDYRITSENEYYN